MKRKLLFALLSLPLLTGCTYNPFIANNHTTGNPLAAAIGAGAGAGGVALLGGSKATMVLAGIAGGAIGYYVTTLRYAAGGVLHGGGKVYKIGDYLGIYIPTDSLFEPNTADFLPQAPPILDSAVAVLKRYPDRSILISGNTSGFYRARWEQSISEQRAQKVAAYFWSAGINQSNARLSFINLTYVGHGDYFPIANKIRNDSIRESSRIQITSYPPYCDLIKGIDVVAHRMPDRRVAMALNDVVMTPPAAMMNPPEIPCETTDASGRCMD